MTGGGRVGAGHKDSLYKKKCVCASHRPLIRQKCVIRPFDNTAEGRREHLSVAHFGGKRLILTPHNCPLSLAFDNPDHVVSAIHIKKVCI